MLFWEPSIFWILLSLVSLPVTTNLAFPINSKVFKEAVPLMSYRLDFCHLVGGGVGHRVGTVHSSLYTWPTEGSFAFQSRRGRVEISGYLFLGMS